MRQKFPGDNSIDHRRALEDFSIQDESKTPTTAEQSARAKQDTETLRRIVSSRPGLRELVGLTVVGDGAGTLRPGRGTESGSGGQTATRRFQSKDGAELDRVFGVSPHASVRGDDCFTRKMATCWWRVVSVWLFWILGCPQKSRSRCCSRSNGCRRRKIYGGGACRFCSRWFSSLPWHQVA